MVKYKEIRVQIKLSILVKVSFVVGSIAGAGIYTFIYIFFTCHYEILNTTSREADFFFLGKVFVNMYKIK